jgi:serine/threonine protein kinase
LRDAQALAEEVAAALGASIQAPMRPGGQKRVYLATLGGEQVVLKVVPLMPPHSDLVLERARREVSLLANFDDRRVVAVRSGLVTVGPAGTPDGLGWLEELLDGDDLGSYLGQPWPWPDVLDLVEGLASGLALFHSEDVIHRDLSPGNVRRRADGTWTLLDPGLAKHLAKASITGLYQPGTPGFRSPEHVPGGTPGTSSDVYGVGILAFAALTAALPIDPSGEEDDYYRRLRETNAPAIASLRSDIPDSLADVIDMCLDRQPARRYLDAEELLDALNDARPDLDALRSGATGASVLPSAGQQ